MFPYTLSSILLWIICYSLLTKRVMNFQKELDEWLGEATFFPITDVKDADDPLVFCLDDLAGCSDGIKVQNQVNLLEFGGLSDIFEDGWMDEKIDLPILDSAEELLPSVDDSEKLLSSDAFPFLDCVADIYSDPLSVLSSPVSTPDVIADHEYSTLTHVNMGAASETATSCASMLPEMGLQLPDSPADACSIYSSSNMSPSDASEITSDSDFAAQKSSEIASSIEDEQNVTVLQVKTLSAPRKSGKDLSMLRRKLKVDCSPYKSPHQAKADSRKERKKVQNKDAAARYRLKKREQDQLLSEEVAALEAVQAKLQKQHDELQTEIKYLKSFMRDLFKARGILK